MSAPTSETIPKAFMWRRLHSLTGLWLVAFLFFHLLTNSQAALFFGDDGIGFIHSVNSIHDLPYLPVIEFLILAFPIIIHMVWGIIYLRSAEYNSFGNSGHGPYLPEYPRNHAYTWQRITSWILVIGIVAHVIHMRFIEYPTAIGQGIERTYMVRLNNDEGLSSLSERLGFKVYDVEQAKQLHVSGLEKRPLSAHEVVAVTNNFGTAELLMVRDTFKMPIMIALYTIFVLTACYHAFNGLWTFMISWGVTLTARSQWLMRKVSTALMVIVTMLGLSAIWLTYWINLKQ